MRLRSSNDPPLLKIELEGMLVPFRAATCRIWVARLVSGGRGVKRKRGIALHALRGVYRQQTISVPALILSESHGSGERATNLLRIDTDLISCSDVCEALARLPDDSECYISTMYERTMPDAESLCGFYVIPGYEQAHIILGGPPLADPHIYDTLTSMIPLAIAGLGLQRPAIYP